MSETEPKVFPLVIDLSHLTLAKTFNSPNLCRAHRRKFVWVQEDGRSQTFYELVEAYLSRILYVLVEA